MSEIMILHIRAETESDNSEGNEFETRSNFQSYIQNQ